MKPVGRKHNAYPAQSVKMRYQKGGQEDERHEIWNGQDVSARLSGALCVVRFDDSWITALTWHRRQHQHHPVVQRRTSVEQNIHRLLC